MSTSPALCLLRFGLVGLLLLSGSASAAPKLAGMAVSPGEAAVENAFQRELVLEQQFVDEHRLQTIRFHVGRGAARFCAGRTRWSYGFAVANQYSFAAAERRIARDAYGFGDRLRVLHVIRNSPAYQAGLRSGDAIMRVNGAPIAAGSGAVAAYSAAASGGGDGRLRLAVEGEDGTQGAYRRDMILAAVRVCDFKIHLADSHRVGASMLGNGITVTKGMLWFAGDAELAFVISHELVHVVRDHIEMIDRHGVRQADAEAEADYMGLYIMARGGYDIGRAPPFWRRMAANFPRLLVSARSHPATSYRFVAMKKTVAEINAKMAAGRPLVPGADPKLANAAITD